MHPIECYLFIVYNNCYKIKSMLANVCPSKNYLQVHLKFWIFSTFQVCNCTSFFLLKRKENMATYIFGLSLFSAFLSFSHYWKRERAQFLCFNLNYMSIHFSDMIMDIGHFFLVKTITPIVWNMIVFLSTGII